MADITKCKGDGCPIKEDCYRFTARGSEWQSYFSVVPYDIRLGCDQYWDNKEYKQSPRVPLNNT